MALITCPECGRQVSDAAQVCPNCGYPIGKKEDKKIVIRLDRCNGSDQRTTAYCYVSGEKKSLGRQKRVEQLYSKVRNH